MGANWRQTAQKEFQRELDDTIYELPDPPRLELGDGVIYFGSKICQKKQEEDTVLEQIKKKEYNFDEIKDPFDKATVPLQLDFVMGEIIKISFKQYDD